MANLVYIREGAGDVGYEAQEEIPKSGPFDRKSGVCFPWISGAQVLLICWPNGEFDAAWILCNQCMSAGSVWETVFLV